MFNRYHPGDVVQLKSGGQPLTVTSSTNQTADLAYLNNKGEHRIWKGVPNATLKLFEKDKSVYEERGVRTVG